MLGFHRSDLFGSIRLTECVCDVMRCVIVVVVSLWHSRCARQMMSTYNPFARTVSSCA